MRLLLVNANTSEFVTAKVADAARRAAAPGTEIVPVTGRFGARVIATAPSWRWPNTPPSSCLHDTRQAAMPC